MSASPSREPIVVTHESGVKFAAQVRSHRIVVDQPERGGGNDEGPMPLELLGAALGTCVALYVQKYLSSRALPFEGMRVEVEQHNASSPHRVGEFAVRVVLPAELPEHHAAMLEKVARSCPAHATFEHGAGVTFKIETEAPAAV
jgi:uncharacterized OsmC-like protein